MKKPKLTIMYAIPRSGKSTYVKENFENKEKTVIISRDSIREELFGTRDVMNREEEVNNVFLNRFNKAIKAKLDIVIDNTNLKKQYRKLFIDSVKQYGYFIEVIAIETSIETIYERCDKTLFPKEVIQRMRKSACFPSLEEGIDKITVVKGEKND